MTVEAGISGLRLRPLSIGDILDETFLVYKRQFVAFVTMMGVMVMPSTLLTLLLVVVLGILASRGSSSETAVFGSIAVGLISIPISIVTSLARIIAGIAAVQVSSDVMLGRPVDIRGAYRHAFNRLGSVLLASLLIGLVTGVACFCFPAAIFFGISWGLVFPAIVLEGQGGIDSMRRSWDLIRDHRWRLLACTILIGMLVSVLILIPASLFVVGIGIVFAVTSFGAAGTLVVQVGQLVGQALGETLFGALGYIMLTRFYYDLRVRKEAFDLEQRLVQVEGAWTPRPSDQPLAR